MKFKLDRKGSENMKGVTDSENVVESSVKYKSVWNWKITGVGAVKNVSWKYRRSESEVFEVQIVEGCFYW